MQAFLPYYTEEIFCNHLGKEKMMAPDFAYFADLATEAPPPTDGILSRTLFQDERVKVVLFGFAQGQELSEHTAAKPAILQFIKGEATVGLGEETHPAVAGTFIHMAPNLKHRIQAKTPTVMLLLLLK